LAVHVIVTALIDSACYVTCTANQRSVCTDIALVASFDPQKPSPK